MLFNGKFYNKPGHLGMTRQQLKDALAGGAAIPEVSSEDVGKNLVIDDEGKIVVQKVFKIEITESGGIYSTTVTPNDVSEHYQKGEKIAVSFNGLDFYDITFSIPANGAFVPIPILLRNTTVYPGGAVMVFISVVNNQLDNPYGISVFLIPFAT